MEKSTLVLLLLFTVGVCNALNDYSGRVKFRCAPDVDYTDSINAYLRRIPNNITVPPYKDNHMMGFKISPSVFTELGTLWTYRPYYTFCVDNQTFMQTTVFTEDPLILNVNWKSCTGSKVRLATKISANKLRLYFMATPTREEPTRVIMYNLGPDGLEDPKLLSDGLPIGLRQFLDVMSIVAMPHVELFWRRFLRVEVPDILRVSLNV